MRPHRPPNVLFVFGDQWRAQATGYAGNPDVLTPNLDRLAACSINVTQAVAGCPVCSPYRASMLSGQYPLTHGVFVNDVCLRQRGPSLAQAFREHGYETAYVGKWHVDGHGRSNYIPPDRRQGFEYWKVLECTHNYNHSRYYAGSSAEQREWGGYDAAAQTRDVEDWLRQHDRDSPFLMILSWGPPHAPYHTAPAEFAELYDPERLTLRGNVPDDAAPAARRDLAGYYAHCSALDACLGDLWQTLRETGQEENTVLVFTADHGDMLGSHGEWKKQRPWDESVRVPFLLHFPARLGTAARTNDALLDAPDIMPTLLGLCGLPVPPSVEGLDFSGYLAGGEDPSGGAALLMCPHPFGQWTARQHGGREYRGLRTRRYTYVQDRSGPWLLYDNLEDPWQLQNLVDDPAHRHLIEEFGGRLQQRLDAMDDAFLPGTDYIAHWNYPMNENGTVPYTN